MKKRKSKVKPQKRKSAPKPRRITSTRLSDVPMFTERWLNMTDVMQMLQLSRVTIGKYIKEKGLPAYKVGKAWNFKKSEIDRWLRQFLPRIH